MSQSVGATATAGGLLDYDVAVARFDPVLGLEVHVELNTASKMFCGCPTAFGADPNTQVCPVCLGLPGALPVVNRRGVESAILIGLALGCEIAEWCRFARKNYFYPDQPKNYQISQYDEPIAFNGEVTVEVDGTPYTIGIERAHMEEDTGKSLHVGGATGRIHGADHSALDFNRAGVPLIEIVTKPVEGTGAAAPQVARAYVTMLRDLLRALGVSDVRMEQGSLRCDANVSLRRSPDDPLGTRTETKNVNSLRSVERALTYEIRRQAAVLTAGGTVTQETRHFHEDTGVTTPGRSKETAEDYRYFPEPDLVPIAPSREWVEELRGLLPEPPAERVARLTAEYGYTVTEMRDVTAAGALDLIEVTIQAGATPQAARKWWMGELSRTAREIGKELEELAITPEQVVEVQQLVESGALTDKLARQALEGVVAGEGTVAEVVESRGLVVVSDEGALAAAVDAAIAADPAAVARIREGKVQAAGALIGAVMKQMSGKADAARIRELVLERVGVVMSDCVFCGIVAGEIPSYGVGETEQALAFLDISQLTPGHTLVVPKRHVPDLVDADGALAEIAPLVEETARLLDRRLEPAGINLLQSSRAYAGQDVFHLHVHLVPRYRGDGGLPGLLDPGKEPVPADELAEIRSHLMDQA